MIAAGLAVVGGAMTAQAATAPAGSNLTFTEVNSDITTDTRWERNTVYILTRLINVTNNATLTIEPGTIIRGIPADTVDAQGVANSSIEFEPGALVVAKGSKLVANGTADDPIIFTSIDDTNVPGGALTVPASFTNSQSVTFNSGVDYGTRNYAPDGVTGDNGFAWAKQWGGVVICGKGHVAQNTQNVDADSDGIWDDIASKIADPVTQNTGIGRDFIEGFDPLEIPNAAAAIYGDLDDSDNSGVLRFVSIRYSGFDIGGFDGNEINSLTIGGVGEATVFDFIECTFNFDDGFEWFGGKHIATRLFALYCQDDGLDGDEGFRGTIQFATIIKPDLRDTNTRSGYQSNNTAVGHFVVDSGDGPNYGDKLIEWDGAEPNDSNGLPRTNVAFYNVTAKASAKTENGYRARRDAIILVNNAATDGAKAISQPANTSATPPNFFTQMYADNIHYNYSGPSSFSVGAINGDVSGGATEGIGAAGVNSEASANTGITNVYGKNGVDPRLVAGTGARVSDGPLPPAGFVQVNYAGFQRENTFLNGWSQLDYLGVLPTSNLARPAVSLGVNGSNPVVTFDSVSGVLYVIEKSADGKTWTPVNGGNPVTGTGSSLAFTDTSTTLVSGTPIRYRVMGL